MDDAFLKRLGEELEHANFFQKRNDLYEFHQSDDLKNITTPLVGKLKEVLYGEEFRTALSAMTGIQLSGLQDSVAISCAVYQDTHRLLCHDDELAGRRIAYILYLVPAGWKKTDGGCLDLFAVDSRGEPSTVAASLVPEWNSFA
jgi:Rps23 Pro-64 3,4-dihydroxylase Tpa1-like proline 4-hydroxylase